MMNTIFDEILFELTEEVRTLDKETDYTLLCYTYRKLFAFSNLLIADALQLDRKLGISSSIVPRERQVKELMKVIDIRFKAWGRDLNGIVETAKRLAEPVKTVEIVNDDDEY
jgi:hypothetical protein